jgi:hypothetical protein
MSMRPIGDESSHMEGADGRIVIDPDRRPVPVRRAASLDQPGRRVVLATSRS